MKLILSCSFLAMLISSVCFAQRKNSEKSLKSNDIEIAFTHSFKVVNEKITQDSTLTVTRKYNRIGKTTHTILHDSLGSPEITYEYLYDNDGHRLIGHNVYAHPNYYLLHSSSTQYNKKGRPVKHYNAKPGRKKTLLSKRFYNKNNQLTSIEYYRNGNTKATKKHHYDNAGELDASELVVHVNTPENKKILIQDDLIETYIQMNNGHGLLTFNEEYNDDELVSTFSFFANESIVLLGADDMVELKEGDNLCIQIEYDDKGLMENKTQFVNDQLHAFVKFYYGKFIDK